LIRKSDLSLSQRSDHLRRNAEALAARSVKVRMNEIVTQFLFDQAGTLPGMLGFEWTDAQPGLVQGRLAVQKRHMAPNGYLHAATVVALTDTACGFGCRISLPHRASGFTTVELKTNFIGTARQGDISCIARLMHKGRTTQIWDAEIKSEHSRKVIALFRCTQIILYGPRDTNVKNQTQEPCT
jgi:1,4-dihydroxy-2-naphthoyl-CoA hydrolase